MEKPQKRGPGRPRTRFDTPERAAAVGTLPGEARYIIIAKTEMVDRMKDVAYWERLSLKEVYAEAITDRIKKYEKKNGPLKKRPEGK